MLPPTLLNAQSWLWYSAAGRAAASLGTGLGPLSNTGLGRLSDSEPGTARMTLSVHPPYKACQATYYCYCCCYSAWNGIWATGQADSLSPAYTHVHKAEIMIFGFC